MSVEKIYKYRVCVSKTIYESFQAHVYAVDEAQAEFNALELAVKKPGLFLNDPDDINVEVYTEIIQENDEDEDV